MPDQEFEPFEPKPKKHSNRKSAQGRKWYTPIQVNITSCFITSCFLLTSLWCYSLLYVCVCVCVCVYLVVQWLVELAKLYKQLDDKVHTHTNTHTHIQKHLPCTYSQ